MVQMLSDVGKWLQLLSSGQYFWRLVLARPCLGSSRWDTTHDNVGPRRPGGALATEGVAVYEMNTIAGASLEERAVGHGHGCVCDGGSSRELEEGGEEGEEEHFGDLLVG